jgi:hypothetical protein
VYWWTEKRGPVTTTRFLRVTVISRWAGTHQRRRAWPHIPHQSSSGREARS